MPWTPEDARKKTKKAKRPKQQRQWAHVANGVLKATGDDARAIREANAVVARSKRGGGTRPKKR